MKILTIIWSAIPALPDQGQGLHGRHPLIDHEVGQGARGAPGDAHLAVDQAVSLVGVDGAVDEVGRAPKVGNQVAPRRIPERKAEIRDPRSIVVIVAQVDQTLLVALGRVQHVGDAVLLQEPHVGRRRLKIGKL